MNTAGVRTGDGLVTIVPNAVCGNDSLEPGEACDDGNVDAGDCCSTTCQFESDGSPCGSSSDTPCDKPDTCNGAGACQINHEPTTTQCRADAGQCDLAENCNGAGACPADSFETAVTGCIGLSQGGICDDADHCSGSSNTCIDVYKSGAVVCRADAGQCDIAESCSGTAGACPSDAFEPVSSSCTGASQAGVCDNDSGDHCAGSSDACVDVYKSSSVVCRADAGECDVVENCSGISGVCPANGYESGGTACGSGTNTDCDDPDTCDGSGICLDNYEPFGTFCDDGSVCTIEDACDGAGSCAALTTVFNRSCTYFSLGAATERPTRGQVGHTSVLTGDLCFTRSKVFRGSEIVGNLVALQSSGRKGVRFSESCLVSGDVATAGAGVFSELGAFLPHVTPDSASIAGGSLVSKDVPPGGVYDTTGSSALVADCTGARADVLSGVQELQALAANQSNDDTYFADGSTLTLTPTTPGAVNVIEYERLRGASDVTINVDGGGNADTVMILRVSRGIILNENAVIAMTNGMQAKNFILVASRGRSDFGNFSTLAGTIYSGGFLRVGQGSTVDGQLFGARRVEINADVIGTLEPNEVVLP